MADGEISAEQLDELLASLRNEDAQNDWKLYHQIGDLLRSDDMNFHLSASFSERMAARLDAEPVVIAPAVSKESTRVAACIAHDQECQHGTGAAKTAAKRWAIPGMAAAAAMAAVAFVATPQLMVAFKGKDASEPASISVAGNTAATAGDRGSSQETVLAASASGEVVVRDPHIDDYLFAHQRYSPSVYSTAQYARSATFATESTK